ncbi:hypothetical protein QBL02_09420 [Leucobacter sp. UT-8R-CII-1-4]|uniref:glycosyltransferase n=1 Tax=Leucobacter sp. UT-8R-CII-1-4 TaxID=3040075 RepID=UPI0024A8E919|nr:hypothetical protein [Leucobacter sp. UT-8R-CII-1-4]MDI6023766.1 hypothetical protein [Leucobacter sp. UT-8R-CII-1-4]
MESAAREPDGVVGKLAARLLGGGSAPVTTVPESAVKVYVAPTNYAGQGFLWARALEQADPKIGARNMAIQLPGGFAFQADTLVPIAAINASAEWAEAEWQAASKFTHVLVEAERPMFGKRFGRNVEAEVAALEAAGVSVAFISHGTDIRNPAMHQLATPWSPYPEDPRTETLQADAEANLDLLQRLGRPVFISTPDLAAELPDSHWCPVIADVARFQANSSRPLFSAAKPRVIHVSSDPLQKGSDRIAPALQPLIDADRIDYKTISGVPSAEMPAVLAAADIVLDQFRLGSYGVAACEAMASGRVVVGHVLPSVRERIRQETGFDLPVVEATLDTLHATVEGLLADPDRARITAHLGQEYVKSLHNGEASARALLQHWIQE